MRKLIVILLAVSAFAFGLFTAPQKTFSAPLVAPPISLAQFDKLITDAAGKAVVINVFASWCGPCRNEISELIRVRQQFPVEQVAFIGLSVDNSMHALQKFAVARNFNYPIFQDDGSIAPAIRVSAIPLNIILTPDGNLFLRQEGAINEEKLSGAIKGALAAR